MKKLLFVCLGNICRSPAAESIMNHYIKQNGLEKLFQCDSAGTSAYHVGEPANSRMKNHAQRRGYDLTSRSRQFDKNTDFDSFDYILAMDQDNLNTLKKLDRENKHSDKIFLMTDFCKKISVEEVPDPYYRGDEGFEFVINILEDSCSNFLDQLTKKTHE